MTQNWFLNNLLCGFKTAFFIPSAIRVKSSWHGLIAIAVITGFLQFLIECVVVGAGAELNYDWYVYHLALFCTVFMTSYFIYCLDDYLSETPEDNILNIATTYYNSYFYLFIPYAILNIFDPPWYGTNLVTFLTVVMPVWAFLVMFRITSEYLQLGFFRIILAACLAAGSMYILNTEVYFVRMLYDSQHTEEDEPSAWDKLSGEELFAMQDELRRKSISGFTPSKRGQTDIYALTLGTYAHQDVFMRESLYVTQRLKEALGIKNIVTMINNEKTFTEYPIANATNLKASLHEIKEKLMQPDEDIALIYLTSHGDVTGLAVQLKYQFSQMNLTPEALAQILKDSGIKNKIVIISACHSGVFIPHLQDENTMIITASAGNKPAYGCSDEADLTYFAEAYFKHGLAQTTNLEEAFVIAKGLIEQREKSEKLDISSDPQIYIGEHIKSVMKKYRAVPIEPKKEPNIQAESETESK